MIFDEDVYQASCKQKGARTLMIPCWWELELVHLHNWDFLGGNLRYRFFKCQIPLKVFIWWFMLRAYATSPASECCSSTSALLTFCGQIILWWRSFYSSQMPCLLSAMIPVWQVSHHNCTTLTPDLDLEVAICCQSFTIQGEWRT